MSKAKKKTAKKVAVKKAKKKTAKRGKSRADKIRAVLGQARSPMTVREICASLRYKPADAKFVSSILIGEKSKKAVTTETKTCPITDREVTAFTLRKGA